MHTIHCYLHMRAANRGGTSCLFSLLPVSFLASVPPTYSRELESFTVLQTLPCEAGTLMDILFFFCLFCFVVLAYLAVGAVDQSTRDRLIYARLIVHEACGKAAGVD